MATAFQYFELLFKYLKLFADNWKYVLPVYIAFGALGSYTIATKNDELEAERSHKDAIIQSSAYREELLQPVISKTIEKTTIINSDCAQCATLEGEVRKLKRGYERWHGELK